ACVHDQEIFTRDARPLLFREVRQFARALRQSFAELPLFARDDFDDLVSLFRKVRIRLAVLFHDRPTRCTEKLVGDADRLRVADRPTNEAAQRIAALDVTWPDAVGDQKRRRANVVCNYAEGVLVVLILLTRRLSDLLNERPEEAHLEHIGIIERR